MDFEPPTTSSANRSLESALSYTAALALRSEDALAPLVQGIALPLLLLSGILLPMALAPEWLQTLSNLNPLTHAVDAGRALFNGLWGDPEIVIGVAVTGILAIFAVWTASRAFSRAAAEPRPIPARDSRSSTVML